VRVLLETKFGTDLKKEEVRSSVLAQALYYCKRFEERGDDLPNVIFIGDESHCFAISFESVKEFLNAEVDWSRRPSSPDASLKVSHSAHLEPTLGVDGHHLKSLCEQLSEGCLLKVKPSKKNISAMYQYWVEHIIPEDLYEAVEMTDIFFGCVFYSEEDDHFAYAHPSKKETLVMGGKEYRLNLKAMEAFFERRERGLSAKEIDELVSMRDRIIEDDTRRRQGAFYTPTLWVNEAHSEMDKVLGEGWRDECIVWDCCAGTGNLTRDFDFENLILSTAEAPDVKAIVREGYNEGAEVFQYDFLNPESDSPFFSERENVLPLSVKKMLRKGAESGKRLVFLINPPYATAGVKSAESRKGVASTIVNQEMKGAKLGACSQQLYAQFLFQCEQVASEYGFKDKSVGVFSPILYMVSGSFAKFRPYWYERYSYQSGFMFQASHFADVKGSWAISFTLWNEGTTEANQDLPLTLKDIAEESVVSLRRKNLYSATEREASKWVGLKNSTAKKSAYLTCRSGLMVSGEKIKHDPKGLVYFVNDSNSPYQNQLVYFAPLPPYSNNRSIPILAGEGFRRAIALYSARKLSTDTWINNKDEYLAPQTEKEGYEQWVDDCHVYALLHISNNMSAMRGVEYKGQTHNIHNHFFWMTRKEALDLYGSHKQARALYRDAKSNPIPYEKGIELGEDVTPEWRKNGDPYFSHVLPTLNLSDLAKEIMTDLRELFVESFALRSKTDHVVERGKSIDLHLGAWDAGIYQHKKMWYTDPVLKAKWDALREKHSRLGKSLEHGVYSYGFLKK
jgi:hypothetical protein